MGYFRILYYISYIFNTVSRLIRRNKKFFMTLLIVGLILFMFLSNQSHAIYMGNDDYSNAEYNITKAYNSVCLDFLRRFDNAKKNHTHDTITEVIEDRLKGAVYDYYLFYGNYNDRLGQLMINGAPLDTSYVFIFMYPKNNGNFSVTTSIYDSYLGNTCDIKSYKATSNRPSDQYYLVALDMQGLYYSYTIFNNDELLIPSSLLHNSNQYIFDYFVNNKTLEQIELLHQIDTNVNEINESITNNEMTQEQQEETNDVIEDSQEIFDTEYSQDYHSYINSFYSSISDQISNYVANPNSNTYIDFTLPFVNYTYRLHSNSISSVLFLHDRSNTIRNFITLFWWVAFSIPIFYLLRRIIIWFGTGEFINKPSKFAVYMTDFIDKNITPGMM